MRKWMALLAIGFLFGPAAPARAQSLSNFMSSSHASSLGGNPLAGIKNVPINTSAALQAPLPSSSGGGSFGYLSGMFRKRSTTSFPSSPGTSNYPTHGTYPTTNYQQLKWPYSNLFNITGGN